MNNDFNSKREYEELSDKTLELMILREMILNPDFLGKMCEVVDYRWFRTSHIQTMAKFIVQYFQKYGKMVTGDLMESVLQKRNESQVIESNKIDVTAAMFDFNKAKDLDLGGMDESVKMAKIQNYVKREALRCALLEAAEKIDGKPSDDVINVSLGKMEDIQKILFEKVDFGVEMSSESVDDAMMEHMDFLTNPAARISTGWKCLDDNTHGGFYKDGKSLYVFMGQAGLGKSNILANLGYNFLKQNLKVAVISMEMSQDVYLRRFDALITKINIDELGFECFKDMVRDRMAKFFKEEHPEAKLNVKEYPPNSRSATDIQTYVENLIEAKGWKPDVLIVDYLNILKPSGASSASGDASMYQDGKIISEQLRKLSYDLGIPVITAVQCNSSGFNTADIGMQNIAESRGIAHTADFIAGMYQTEDESLDGIFHMKVLKSRLGNKGNFKFEFNSSTMEFKDINDVDSSASELSDRSDGANKSLPRISDVDFDPFSKDVGMP